MCPDDMPQRTNLHRLIVIHHNQCRHNNHQPIINHGNRKRVLVLFLVANQCRHPTHTDNVLRQLQEIYLTQPGAHIVLPRAAGPTHRPPNKNPMVGSSSVSQATRAPLRQRSWSLFPCLTSTSAPARVPQHRRLPLCRVSSSRSVFVVAVSYFNL